MSETSEDHSTFYDFPLQKIVISIEYLVIAVLCFIQSLRIVKNHHKCCGFQNLLIIFLICWCLFRISDLMIRFFLILFTHQPDDFIDQTTSVEWLISDIPSFVMVGLLSFFIYYYLFLIHSSHWQYAKLISIIIIITINLFHILSLISIDISLMIKPTTAAIHLTFCCSSFVYLLVVGGLLYVSVRIFFINPHVLEQSHPKPSAMGVCGLVICLAISTRLIYDFSSAIVGQSILSLLCSNESSFCSEHFGIVVFFSQIIEVVLMSLWEIVPLTTLVILFWNIPSNKSYDPFPHFQYLVEETDDSSYVTYDATTPLI
ncbi:hypothetical protein ENUP19_0216G0012 [Entamoeba nuttalli]|uniref:THH1/TOM1/TOM3 domain-containing protein n=2 Tax=Entamoeba nuttalli TaxID=412467 RepID=K2HY93_ENTNP|nr:hypothetical protein ENU1_059070 [Entamoeba nuttalli P19]EKE41340.1 hypothetical protein ENU1_059070 [Entamoeba nuttalli P19]|eukprot:XP_008856323.1 hypothetical protein ENU1_059070 [Entamoeba nuttalli P19]